MGVIVKNIAIVEDNDQYASVITEYINKYMTENNVELNIIRFHNADDFLKDYQQIYSVILMDIQMPGIDGMNASYELRKIDKTERVYKVPGNKFVLNLITWVPFVLLVASIIFTLFIDFTWESFMYNLPLIIGVAVSLVVQEILAARVK